MRTQITVKQKSRDIPDIPKFLEEGPKRTKAVVGNFTFLAAKFMLKYMLRRIPRNEETKAYREALVVGKLMGAPQGALYYSVKVDMMNRRIKSVKPNQTLVWVMPKNAKVKRPKPIIKLLEQYNPWTLNLLPFVPSPSDATLIQKKVSKREVSRVTKSKKLQLRKLKPKLTRYKHEAKGRGKAAKFISKLSEKVPSVIFTALRMEFGLGADRARPHWRPSVKFLYRFGMRAIVRKNKVLTKALTKADFRQWKKWPPKTRKRVKMSEAKQFKAFQKLLGIRIG